MPLAARALPVAFLLFAPALLAQPLPVIIDGAPVAASPSSDGDGLCLSARSSTNPFADFPQNEDTFASGLNAFLEAAPDARVTHPLRTPLDLSNAIVSGGGPPLSAGDFTDAVPGCPEGGCGFPWNDATTSFGMRLRAFFHVTEELVGQPLHFGLYADDAVAMTVYDAQGVPHPVVVRPPALGLPAWRVTNAVTFSAAGLYPVEILYAQVSEHAALEVSLFVGEYADFERAVGQAPESPLDEAGFTLLTPASFFLATDGVSVDDAACQQCDRQSAGLTGNGGCPASQRCNAAAVCELCDDDAFCGGGCTPCGPDAPRCAPTEAGLACVGCIDDADCGAGAACEQNACVTVDAGATDAGAEDAGTRDAGNLDGGRGLDAGTTDAGSGDDAGDVDAGPAPDAGSADDAGSTDDAGTNDGPEAPEPSGCGCRQADSGPSLALWLLAAGLLLRRRRDCRMQE